MEKQNYGRISELASIISENTATFEEYLQAHNIPTPSFDKETPFTLELPQRIHQAQDTVLEASIELQALVGGPIANIRNQTMPVSSKISILIVKTQH
jgi:hypothetical protein